MNLVLFEADELGVPLPHADGRAQHILRVLRLGIGDVFLAGVVNGGTGLAKLVAATSRGLELEFTPGILPPPLPKLELIIGLPRPQTARDILRDATTLGATRIRFVTTQRSDPNYATSSLWSSGEWRRQVLAGLAQACDTRLPQVSWSERLDEAVGEGDALRLALDNYEAETSLVTALAGDQAESTLTLALGPERGWGPEDRAVLRQAGFTLCSLGTRVLRLETAVVSALALAGTSRA